ncbi:MAG: AI-2E family transporter [Candidatus Sericytochromatia bacterium]|nr:AI-2E family transporter [Candidatus Sericytochromatia bacterium]
MQIIVFSLVIAYFALMLAQYFSGILALLISAGLIAFLSHEMITPMVKRGFSVNGAMAIVYVTIISAVILAIVLMFPVLFEQATQLANNLPDSINNLQKTGEKLLKPLSSIGIHVNLESFSSKITDYLQKILLRVTENFPVMVLNGFSIFLDSIIAIVIAIYLVKDFESMWRVFLSKTGNHAVNWEYIRQELTKSLRGFVKGQLFSGLYMLVATSTAYTLIGLKFGLVAGVILGLLEVIPYFGAFIGMALVSALALSQSFNMFIIALVLTVIIQQIKDNILLPKWLNESIGIHPLGVFISILIGGRVAGFMGIFLAIPLAGLVQALIRVIFSYDSDIAKDIDNKEFMEIESNTIIELK